MSAEIKKITADEIYAVSMRRLADRPNSASANGRGALSSAELKGYMDKFPKLVADRLNHLIDMINAGSDEGILCILKTPIVDEKTQNEITLLEWIRLASDDLAKKLDAVTVSSDLPQAYVKDRTGSQTMMDITRAVMAQSIMQRDGYGRSKIASPSENDDIANKKYVDDKVSEINAINQNELDSKLDKVSDNTSKPLAYAVIAGSQSMVTLTDSLDADTVMMRDAYGRVEVANPVSPTQATNKNYVDNKLATKLDKSGGTVTGNLTVGGNFTVKGSNTIVDSTTLKVSDKVIEVAKDNTVPLTSPAGLVVPKYDGANYGALVYDSTGTAYVGDVVLDEDGNINTDMSNLQPLTTRGGDLYDGVIPMWSESDKTLNHSPLSAILENISVQQEDCSASGYRSFAIGSYTQASGQSSFALGDNTIANGDYQCVAGKYNVANTTSVRITGGGTSTVRNNIEELDWSGNLKLAGGLTLDMNGSASTISGISDSAGTSSTIAMSQKGVADAIAAAITTTLNTAV